MKLSRILHALTDLALAFCFGGPIVAALAATSIFRVSTQQGFERAHAVVLAGEMFARVGPPLLIAACVVGVGTIYGALRPPLNELPSKLRISLWRAMAVLGVLVALAVGYMEGLSSRRMHQLRREGKWEAGKMVNADEQAEFDALHRTATAIYSFTIIASGALLLSRRTFS